MTWTAKNVPEELVAMLDEAAGKTHSEEGIVRRTLAEMLNCYDEMELATDKVLSVLGPKPSDIRCTYDLGDRPDWMSPDQYDPCRCTLYAGHRGPHLCEHTRI